MADIPRPAIDLRTLDAIIARTIGDPMAFFRDYWRKKPLHEQGAATQLAGSYGIDDFIADLVETQSAPYVSVTTSGGKRVFSKHTTTDDLLRGVRDGGVCAMKASRTWHQTLPPA